MPESTTTGPAPYDTRVFRYEVPVDDQWHDLELSGPILHVDCRDPRVVEFWALHTPGYWCKRTESFTVIGTGHLQPDGYHVGTAIAPGGQLVWHLFRKAADHE